MKKYKGYYYTTNKTKNGFVWRMYNCYIITATSLMEEACECFETKEDAAIAAEENIDEYYR